MIKCLLIISYAFLSWLRGDEPIADLRLQRRPQDKTRRGRRKKHRRFRASDGRIFHLPLSFSATAKCVSPTGRGAFLRVLQIRVRGGVKPRAERFPANLRRPDHAPFLLPQMSQLPRSSKPLYGFTVAAFIFHFALAVGAIAVHWRTT